MASFTLEDLLNLQPSKVSRELNGYITYIYGQPKVGKTTLARDMGAFILQCEDGTRAMSGAYGQIMKSWGDIKTIARFAKDPKFKERYKGFALDTVDVAASLCEKYICQREDVDALGKIPYGGGWSMFKKEFEDTFRTLALEGYAILFISHCKTKTITSANGSEYTQITPTVSDTINNIVLNMSDIIGYAYQDTENDERYLVLRGSNNVVAGTRFPYMEPRIKFGYQHLVDALNLAIDKEESVSGTTAIGERVIVSPEPEVFNHEELLAEFNNIANVLVNKNAAFFSPRITQIIEKYLGKGRKIAETTLDQAELVSLIVNEIKDTLLTMPQAQ